MTKKFIILCGRYRFFFFLIVLPWFGHVFSSKGRFGHKRKLPGFFYFLMWQTLSPNNLFSIPRENLTNALGLASVVNMGCITLTDSRTMIFSKRINIQKRSLVITDTKECQSACVAWTSERLILHHLTRLIHFTPSLELYICVGKPLFGCEINKLCLWVEVFHCILAFLING